MIKQLKEFDIEDRLEALGFRMASEKIFQTLREGAMTLPGTIILTLVDLLASYEFALSQVPRNWLMTHAELAASGLI